MAFAFLGFTLGARCQVIYETGVTVTTVAGKAKVLGNRDGDSPQALLGEVRGIACVGEEAFVLSTFGGMTRLKRVTSTDVSTLLEMSAQSASSSGLDRLVGDAVGASLIWIRSPHAERVNSAGAIIGTLQLAPYHAILEQKALVLQTEGLGLLDFRSGNYTYLAGGGVSAIVDGIREAAGIRNVLGTALADSIGYFSDDGQIRSVTFDGRVTTMAGLGYADAALGIAKANPSAPMVVDNDHNLIFTQDRCIRRVSRNAIRTMAGNASGGGNYDGDGFNARFSNIQGLAVDSRNRLWVADENCVRLLTFAESKRAMPATMGIRTVPGITVSGEVGALYRIEFQESAGRPWQLLMPVVLSKPTQEVFDYDAMGLSRIYRVVLP